MFTLQNLQTSPRRCGNSVLDLVSTGTPGMSQILRQARESMEPRRRRATGLIDRGEGTGRSAEQARVQGR